VCMRCCSPALHDCFRPASHVCRLFQGSSELTATFLADLVIAAAQCLPALIAANRFGAATEDCGGDDALPTCAPLGTNDAEAAFADTYAHCEEANRVPAAMRNELLRGELRSLRASFTLVRIVNRLCMHMVSVVALPHTCMQCGWSAWRMHFKCWHQGC
jgi:hypothetical protein